MNIFTIKADYFPQTAFLISCIKTQFAAEVYIYQKSFSPSEILPINMYKKKVYVSIEPFFNVPTNTQFVFFDFQIKKNTKRGAVECIGGKF